ncbi:MAG: YIP1 family protein [Firmicutes bacterium]|nr:YIP1 family protein [Bacillota bacterium]MBV1728600.1 YIP1 family protein [Desulforudis sp.]MBU4533700.1 YIP1 family protein [Bacillota bacterium]MBU4554801.1 YIP1 family protein [Bacillota bacterium]MBV1735906.1 YIP1 family protein [Desulforudis sp.]
MDPVTEYRGLSMGQRLVGVLTKPGETFTDIMQKPRFWGALGVLCGVALLSVVMVLSKLQAFMLLQLDGLPPVSAQEQATMENMVMTMGAVSGLVGAVVGVVFMCLVGAVILKLVNLFTGERAPFGTFFAVAVFAYVPLVLSALLHSLLRMASPAADFPYITTSLAVLLPKGEMGTNFFLLSQIEPFTIWSLVLLCIGGAVAMKTGLRAVALPLFSLWLLFVVGYAFLMPAVTPGM